MLPGEPSSHEIANLMVGPIRRMARYPAQLISQRRMRCLRVKVRQGAPTLGGDEVAVALTRLFYRQVQYRYIVLDERDLCILF